MEIEIHNAKDFFDLYKKAAWGKDVKGMISLYAEDVLIFDMWGKGYIKGLTEWSDVIHGWLTSLKDENVNVTFEMIDIHESGDTAFGSALIQFQAIAANGEVLRSMKNRITVGLVKTNGAWKVKHQHTSAPIDFELKAILDI